MLNNLKLKYISILNDYIHELSNLDIDIDYTIYSIRETIKLIHTYTIFIRQIEETTTLTELRDFIMDLQDKASGLAETFWGIYKNHFMEVTDLSASLQAAYEMGHFQHHGNTPIISEGVTPENGILDDISTSTTPAVSSGTQSK